MSWRICICECKFVKVRRRWSNICNNGDRKTNVHACVAVQIVPMGVIVVEIFARFCAFLAFV
jgi:hypothetical protein